jgi:hypothetical protein
MRHYTKGCMTITPLPQMAGFVAPIGGGFWALTDRNAVPDRPKPQRKRRGPSPNRMKLALYYQSLLDSGKVESRAALARFLGVSRARVTQVLNRLKEPGKDQAESA